MKLSIAFIVLASALPAVSDRAVRCTDALCLNFQEEVSPNHQHSHRCTDAACVNFQQYVAANHRHLHRNSDANSPYFQQFVPEKHPHRK